jgi:ParB family chromosome partitioning protein
MKEELRNKLRAFPIRKPATPALEKTLGLTRTETFMILPVRKIRPNPDQPRKHFDEEKHRELVLSIRERGILQPIRVMQVTRNEDYMIIAGERRWRAAKEVPLAEVPCIVIAAQAPEQAHIDAIIENVTREDLNAVDRATALVQVKTNLGLDSWDHVAKRIGISRRQVFNLLGLTALPDAVKDDIRIGALSEKHGRALRLVKSDARLLDQAHKTIKRKKLSGDAALAMVRQLRHDRRERKAHIFTTEYHSERELIAKLKAKLRSLGVMIVTKE